MALYKGMKIHQVKEFFMDKEHYPCPLTEMLICGGYQQKSGGYIDRARKEGILVDHTQNSPSQYWHLMSYCNSRHPNMTFSKSIICGELIFWMAEVSKAVPTNVLKEIAKRILASSSVDNNLQFDRIKWNKEIQKLCFDDIIEKVMRN